MELKKQSNPPVVLQEDLNSQYWTSSSKLLAMSFVFAGLVALATLKTSGAQNTDSSNPTLGSLPPQSVVCHPRISSEVNQTLTVSEMLVSSWIPARSL